MTFFISANVLKLLEHNFRRCNARCYARWTHRRPRRVFTSEEYKELEDLPEQPSPEEKIVELNPETDKIFSKKLARNAPKVNLFDMKELDALSEPVHFKVETKSVKKKKAPKPAKREKDTDMLETVLDADGNFIYTKLKDNDPTVGMILMTVKSRKLQVKKDLALLEGKRLIKEALEAQCALKNLIFSRKSDLEYLKPYLPKSGAKLLKMPYREMQLWSDLSTAPGVMGIFKTPNVEDFKPKNCIPLTVICDNIREPGNLGAILRTVAGVGAKSVVLTKGCVDLWDTKVLRSACGAHFCLQIHKKKELDDIRGLLEPNSTVLIADNKVIMQSSYSTNESSLADVFSSLPLLPYYGVRFGDLQELVLIVGGETEGISEESYRLAAEYNGLRLNIPLSNNVDSLNTGTALGVILFEIKRQLAK